jgi:hypothetical protein
MATYLNSTKGARAVHLTNGGHVLVDAGATLTIDESKIKSLAPGLVKSKKGDLPDPPADLVEKVSGEKLSDLSKAELVKRRPDDMSEAAAKKLSRDKLIAAIEG